MKVLWISNLVFPDAAKELGMDVAASGGWLTHFLELLSKTEGVVCRVVSEYRGKEYKTVFANGIQYDMIPAGSSISLNSQKKQKNCSKNILTLAFLRGIIEIASE